MAVLTPKEIAARLAASAILKDNASDADASKCASVYPVLTGDGKLIHVGTRINKDGELYRARINMWDTEENTPDRNPNAWEKILYKRGYRVIEGEITAENPVTFGERIWFNETLYESVYEGSNVWTPERYPEGYKALK